MNGNKIAYSTQLSVTALLRNLLKLSPRAKQVVFGMILEIADEQTHQRTTCPGHLIVPPRSVA